MKVRLLLLLVSLVAIGGLLKYCDRPTIDDEVREEIASLPKDVREKLIIKEGKLIDVTHKSGSKRFVPEEGRSEVVIKEDGKVVVTSKTKGWCFRPGVAVGMVGTSGRVLTSVKVGYWGRFGLVVGTPIHKVDYKSPYLGGSCVVWRNTSLFVGMNSRTKLVYGARISF